MTEACQAAAAYRFGGPSPDQRGATAALVGNKALNLIRMAAAGLPVPPGLVLPTTFWRRYFQEGRRLPADTADLLSQGICDIEKTSGLSFGGDRRPLLVAVRSGSTVSMPGMMDTILNIGLCERTVPALIRMTGNPRHAWDSYRRLVASYAEIVSGLPAGPFERLLADHLRRQGVAVASALDVAGLKNVTHSLLGLYQSLKKEPFPQDPFAQLTGAVEGILRSWENPRATEYRRLHTLDAEGGTAVTIQAMVFGNLGGTSGAGVAFTRDPATGENALYLDFLPNAQGDEVVMGRCAAFGPRGWEQASPELLRQLRDIGEQLEQLFRDAQDFEFTVQEGRLFLLQTRDALRTAFAALRIACDLVREGLIDEPTALQRLAAYDLDSIQAVRLATSESYRPIGQGVPASPGVAVGQVVFEPGRARELADAGQAAILVRMDIATEDIAGLAAAAGVLTARGTRTSHAAVVARQLNKPCLVGCEDLVILSDGRSCRIGDRLLGEGFDLSLDGNSGCVYAGRLEVVVEKPTQELIEVRRWQERAGTVTTAASV